MAGEGGGLRGYWEYWIIGEYSLERNDEEEK